MVMLVNKNTPFKTCKVVPIFQISLRNYGSLFVCQKDEKETKCSPGICVENFCPHCSFHSPSDGLIDWFDQSLRCREQFSKDFPPIISMINLWYKCQEWKMERYKKSFPVQSIRYFWIIPINIRIAVVHNGYFLQHKVLYTFYHTEIPIQAHLDL